MRADRELTLAQQYSDYRSFMRSDHSEVLYGTDWDARKWQLWQRAGGRCEYEAPETAFSTKIWRCGKEGQIPAHVEPRYPRRDDRLLNLKCYCVEHDKLMEKQSWRKIRSDKAERRAQQ